MLGNFFRANKIFKMAFVVPTSSGNVKGKLSKNKNNFPYHAFYKIPYAKPPIGNLRFALPQPTEPWTHTLDCTKKVVCTSIQVLLNSPESGFVVGTEDCLYLNVYSPKMPELGSPRPEPLPVLVYIHGGAFCVGGSDPRMYGPEFFIDKGLVVVTINYRLGPLGFFSLGDDAAPGNQGLHDQVLALEWVQKNIAAFGGDPKNVSIMGESAGAMSCFLHLVSPLSQGLFHKIISLSGSATSPFLHVDREAGIYGRAFAQHLGSKREATVEEMLKHLRTLSAKSITNQTTVFKDWDPVTPLQWKPCIDSYASKPFLPKSFDESVKEGLFNKEVVILAGFTSEEGLIFSAPFHKSPKHWKLLFQDYEKWSPLVFFNRETDLVTEKDIEAVKKIRTKFFPANPDDASAIPNFDETNLKLLEEIFSAAMFQAPLVRDLNLLLAKGVKIYTYNFNHCGSMTLLEVFRLPPLKLLMNFSGRHFGAKIYQKDLGTCHGDDLLYLFPFAMTGFPKSIKTEEDQKVSTQMTQMLANLARKGDPNSDTTDSGPIWEPYDGKMFFNFGKEFSCTPLAPDVRERIDFWNDLVEEAGLTDWVTSPKPIPQIHKKPAEKRTLLPN